MNLVCVATGKPLWWFFGGAPATWFDLAMMKTMLLVPTIPALVYVYDCGAVKLSKRQPVADYCNKLFAEEHGGHH